MHGVKHTNQVRDAEREPFLEKELIPTRPYHSKKEALDLSRGIPLWFKTDNFAARIRVLELISDHQQCGSSAMWIVNNNHQQCGL